MVVVLAGAIATAFVIAALAIPSHYADTTAAYRPSTPEYVVTRVSPRDPQEVRARRALASSPECVEIAVDLARDDIGRYRQTSDPKFLGRAQATLDRWWAAPEPPQDVLLLRATIRQSLHEFAEARADLDRFLARAPLHVQAHLTRAAVATVVADYGAARESCTAIANLVTPLVAATCIAPLDAIAGDATGAYERLAFALSELRVRDDVIHGWVLTHLADLATMRGDALAAEHHLRAALAIDSNDAYARDALADALLTMGRDADVSALLTGREAIDSHLLRRAIAEHRRGGPARSELVSMMRERIRSARARGDRVHLREEARFALAVEQDTRSAVELARANWDVQKELADARLLAEAAVAAEDPRAADPVRAWTHRTGVRDAQLARWLERMR